MMFGWGSPRVMRRALPNSEMMRLEKFYEDYMHLQARLMGAKPVEGPKVDAEPAPWDAELITVPDV